MIAVSLFESGLENMNALNAQHEASWVKEAALQLDEEEAQVSRFIKSLRLVCHCHVAEYASMIMATTLSVNLPFGKSLVAHSGCCNKSCIPEADVAKVDCNDSLGFVQANAAHLASVFSSVRLLLRIFEESPEW